MFGFGRKKQEPEVDPGGQQSRAGWPDPDPGQGMPWQGQQPPLRALARVDPPLVLQPADDLPGDQPVINLEDMTLEDLLKFRAKVGEVINEKLAALGMKLKDTAKVTFSAGEGGVWDQLKEALVSLGIAPRKAGAVVTQLKATGKKYTSVQDAIPDAVTICHRR